MKLKSVVAFVALAISTAASAANGIESAGDPSVAAGRLGELAAQAFPIGEMFQEFVDRDPTWPALKKADRMEPQQLACLRDRLSLEGFRRMKIDDARVFIAARPDLSEDSIRVLEQGGAAFMRASVQAGMEQGKRGAAAPDIAKVMSQFNASQLSAAIDFVGNAKYAPLREMIGIGDAIQLAGESPGARNQGASTAMKLMLRAMQQCNVPLSAIQ